MPSLNISTQTIIFDSPFLTLSTASLFFFAELLLTIRTGLYAEYVSLYTLLNKVRARN